MNRFVLVAAAVASLFGACRPPSDAKPPKDEPTPNPMAPEGSAPEGETPEGTALEGEASNALAPRLALGHGGAFPTGGVPGSVEQPPGPTATTVTATTATSAAATTGSGIEVRK